MLTGAVRGQRLLQEHRKRHGRWVQPLAVLGQVRFSDLQQFRAGRRVEELHRRPGSSVAPNAMTTSLAIEGFSTMGQGWPRKSEECALGNEHPINAQPAFCFNCLHPSARDAIGLK